MKSVHESKPVVSNWLKVDDHLREILNYTIHSIILSSSVYFFKICTNMKLNLKV